MTARKTGAISMAVAGLACALAEFGEALFIPLLIIA